MLLFLCPILLSTIFTMFICYNDTSGEIFEIMNETKYYQKIKNIIEKIEINTKVRYLQDNSEKIIGYWNIGKLLVEAQNGEARAKYGNALIKKWSIILKEK